MKKRFLLAIPAITLSLFMVGCKKKTSTNKNTTTKKVTTEKCMKWE